MFCILWLYAWWCTALAQVEDQYLYSETFGTGDGLHHGVIGDFKIDQNELLWISSFGQLQLFDGQQFIDMSHLIKPGAAVGTFNFPASNELLFLKGNILYKFNPKQYASKSVPQFYLPSVIPGDHICKILSEDRQYIYIAHPNDSLYQIDKHTLLLKKVYILRPAFHKTYSWSDLYISDKPSIQIEYITTENRRCRLDLETGTTTHVDSTTFPIGRAALASGDTLVAFHENQLMIYAGQNTHTITLPESTQDFSGDYFLLSGRDSVYIGLRNAIYVLDLRKLTWTSKLLRTGGIPLFDIKMRQMTRDKTGHLYFSTFNTGLVKMYPRNTGFQYIGGAANSKNFIKCVRVSESQNLVLAGTIQNGLFLFDTNGVLKRHILIFPDGHEYRFISCILKVSETRYIILADQAFELTVAHDQFHLRKLPGFQPNWLSYYDNLIEDTINHRYLLFNHYGILEIDPDATPHFHRALFPDNNISIAANQIGEHYVVSKLNDLLYYDQKLNYTSWPLDLPEFGYSRCLYPYAPDKVLLGTDIGLFLVNGKDNKEKYIQLYDHLVYAILPGSGEGEFWFSTDFGLYRLGPDMGISNYSIESGLQENEFNTNSCFKTTSGKLYFGGVNGITAFYPDAVEAMEDFVIPYVSSISVNSEIVGRYFPPDSVPEFNLSSKENIIRIELLGKGSRSPLSYNYQYKVGELHDTWINLGRDIGMQFQFSPGTYTIYYHIDDNFNPSAIPRHAVKITIQPPLIKRWWFITGIVLIPLIMIYYVMNLRRKRKALKAIYEIELDRKLHDERMRISRELHDNIGAQMATVKRNINFLIDHTDRLSPPQAMHKMKDLEGIATQINQELRDTIWAVQNENIDLSVFITRLKNYVFQLLGPESPYRVHYEEHGNMHALLGPFIALNLHRICQESIHNILKHAQATEIWIMIENQQSSLKITIADNGKGFDPEKVFEGYGLGNIRKRAEQIGAEVHFNRLSQYASSLEIFIKSFTSVTLKKIPDGKD